MPSEVMDPVGTGGAVSGRPASGLSFEQAERAAVMQIAVMVAASLLRNVTFVSPP
ncbi:hypothetical protein GCM10028799_36620 [Kribbella italica]